MKVLCEETELEARRCHEQTMALAAEVVAAEAEAEEDAVRARGYPCRPCPALKNSC
jgi:hypothetical protein